MRVKDINSLSAGDQLVRKDTREFCEITQVDFEHRKYVHSTFFHFKGFAIPREGMRNMFENNDRMFFVR